jgi:hypothetical protein
VTLSHASTTVYGSYFLAAAHFSPAARGPRARELSFVHSQISAAGLIRASLGETAPAPISAR